MTRITDLPQSHNHALIQALELLKDLPPQHLYAAILAAIVMFGKQKGRAGGRIALEELPQPLLADLYPWLLENYPDNTPDLDPHLMWPGGYLEGHFDDEEGKGNGDEENL